MKWSYAKKGYWVGGRFDAPNLSRGFHGIMRQWWEHYTGDSPTVLLVSETNKTKEVFQQHYPSWDITTLNMDGDADITLDITIPLSGKFDLVINQAMLEHCYDPFGAMKNMFNILNKGGHLISHTHVPGVAIHRYPRDYFRFLPDWWEDLPNRFNVMLVEHWEDKEHVFTCYRRV